MSKKPKLFKTKKDSELFYYFNAKKEKMFMYRHRYYDALDNRKEKSKQAFESENEAYRELLEVRIAISNGDSKQVENSKLTVSEWLDIWYETKKPSWEISTRNNRKRHIEDIIKPLIGTYKLSELDAMAYERVFINELLKTYSPDSVKSYHNIFKIAVNAAVRNKTIKENNFVHVSIPGKIKKNYNFLGQKDLNTLLAAAKKLCNITMYTLILFMAKTGVRKGEAHALLWENIDFKKQTIKIEWTRDENGVRSPKTLNSYRTIPVDKFIIAQLKKYHTWCLRYKLTYGEILNDDDFVFISIHVGNPINQSTINKSLDTLIKTTGIKRITPHGLRHTHATILLNKGVSVATVAKRLGNTAGEIHRTYGHSDEEADKRAVEIFSSVVNI